MTHDRTRRSGAHPAVAEVSALIGDRGRAAMLCALLDGEKLSAGELARCAELAPNAASAHLAKLIAGGLLVVKASGRQRFYTLASVNVARAMEALAVISRPAKILALSQSYIAEDLRSARSCYDHLAGRLGVAVTESLVEKRMLVPDAGASYAVSAIGDEFFSSLGIDLNKSRRARRHFARQCMDWSERRPHVAGALGAAVREVVFARGWVRRKANSRALRVTDEGRLNLRSIFSIDV